MSDINHGSLINDVANELGLQPGREIIPKTIGNNINLVYPINRKYCTKVVSKISTATADVVVLTTSTEKDSYLVAAQLAVTKDAASDLVAPELTIYDEAGQIVAILNLPLQTTTAESHNTSISFPYPVKIQKGSQIKLKGAFTAGTCSKRCVVTVLEMF